ncbi:hypothetical protein LRF89_10590 [Halorhodospira sp. 9621]|uniref:hypothetical protein n=1 Tax=Halorhodospira TaxID=85108 RepID=UPI001EE7A274|nr:MULTISPECIES: hypothetical protein [Halorhodospira]MCG5528018.1 hypothetical protein [Halorhodospira halophila]MCG5533883.1 hypothetical protein [Halorhodospira sp. 9621]MCG5542112.1 hypothetical protein [Halorhodospira sp. 9628]
MATPVDTFQRYFRYRLRRGRGHDVVSVVYTGDSAQSPSQEPQTSASVELVPQQRTALVRDIRITPEFQLREDEGENTHGDLKRLRHIYSRTFPLPYAAAMAGALAHASNRDYQKLRAYLSRDEIRILPRLFALEHCGDREYQGQTRQLLNTAAERMPVFYEFVCIAHRQLKE